MTIDRDRVDKSLRKIRGLYRHHAEGALSPSSFATKARTEIHLLYMEHTRGLIDATALRFTEEIRSFQAQFGLDLDCSDVYLIKRTRGYRGIRASIYIRSKVYSYTPGSVEIFIGPFDEWDRVAVHTTEEREFGNVPSLYTQKQKDRWQGIQDFDFPTLLQQIKEKSERPEPEYDDDDIPF